MDTTEWFERISQIQWWVDSDALSEATRFIEHVSQWSCLERLVDNVRGEESLLELSEHLRSLEKIVLLNHAPTKSRLRLHCFQKGTYDLLHNHKWPFLSKVLSGRVSQELFSSADSLSAGFRTVHRAGDLYLLTPEFYHKLAVEEPAVTVVMRGPDLINSATWKNVSTGSHWTHVGGKSDHRKIDMTSESLEEVITTVLSMRNRHD